MPDDNRFDEFLRREVQGYKADDAPPISEMWAHIEHDVSEAIHPDAARPGAARPDATRPVRTPTIRPLPARRVWLSVGAALAAALVIGVSVGRWSSRNTSTQQLAAVTSAPSVKAAANDDSTREARYARATAMAHLAETEVFLTSVRSDLKTGHTDADRAERSRELLSRTRLLLAAPANRSPDVKLLLEDLELLLAEIAALPAHDGAMDKRMLNDNMRDGDILPRIRTILPAPVAGT